MTFANRTMSTMIRISCLAILLPGSLRSDAGATAGNPALALSVPGLPENRSEIVWENLPLLESERRMIFTGVKDVTAFNHHPTIAWHSGRFFAAWSNGDRDEDAEGQRVLYTTSEDGVRWTKAARLADPVPGMAYTPSGFWIRAGEVFALAALRPARGHDEIQLPPTVFAWKWQEGKNVFAEPDIVARGFYATHAPERTPKGVWLMPGKIGTGPDTRSVTFARGGIRALDDWMSVRIPRDEAPHDLSWYALADERIVGLEGAGRPPHRMLAVSISADGGASWTPAVRSNFPDADSRQEGLRLSNGSYVILNNPNPSRYRIPLTLAVSRDGLNYDRIANVRIEQTNKRYSGHAKAPGYQYVRAIEHDGRLWVVYSVNKEDVEASVIPIAAIARLQNSPPVYSTPDIKSERVVDNRDAGFKADRAWPTDTKAEGFHGTDYAYLPAKTVGWASWTAKVGEPGVYRIFLRWASAGFSQRSPMEDIAPVEIEYPGGVDRTSVDETRYSGTWVFLQDRALLAGDSITVKITSGGDGITVADAIKLTRVR